eukprot:TRINITY_DN30875_c0_g1_i1.p1 TRINITY_DN30875_c0_g1~~TRINITY_DN30875_c0_g1_i1.p1  ORF type:complete len:619 (+),score=169.44 TRINITY_DN30875_c0_g1_i1:99-1955(+)
MSVSLRAVFISCAKDGEDLVAMTRLYPTVELRHQRLCMLHGMPYSAVNVPQLAKHVTQGNEDEDGFVLRAGGVFPVVVLRQRFTIKERQMAFAFVAVPLVSHLSPSGDRPLPVAGCFTLLEELAAVLKGAKFDFDKVLAFLAKMAPLGTPACNDPGLASVLAHAPLPAAAPPAAPVQTPRKNAPQADHHVTVTQVETLSGDLFSMDSVPVVWGTVLAQRESGAAAGVGAAPAARQDPTSPPPAAAASGAGEAGEGAGGGGLCVSVKGKVADVGIGACVARVEHSTRESDELDLFIASARRIDAFGSPAYSPALAAAAAKGKPPPRDAPPPPRIGQTLFTYTAGGPGGSGGVGALQGAPPDTPSNMSNVSSKHLVGSFCAAPLQAPPMIRGVLRVAKVASVSGTAPPVPNAHPNAGSSDFNASMASLPGDIQRGDSMCDPRSAASGSAVTETVLSVHLQLALSTAVAPAVKKSSTASLDVEAALCFGATATYKAHSMTPTTGSVKPAGAAAGDGTHLVWKLGKLKKTGDVTHTLTGKCTLAVDAGAGAPNPFVDEERCFAAISVSAVGYTTHSKVELALSASAAPGETTALTLAPPVIASHGLRIWNAKSAQAAAARLP